ncbi:MAG: hypothetical protein WD334_10380 [Chitinophagales bacterium]
MEFFKPNPRRKSKSKVVDFKSRLEEKEQFTIKKIKKKRRQKYLSKNQKVHLINRHYNDFEDDFRSPA